MTDNPTRESADTPKCDALRVLNDETVIQCGVTADWRVNDTGNACSECVASLLDDERPNTVTLIDANPAPVETPTEPMRDQSHDRVVVGDIPCQTCGGTDWMCAAGWLEAGEGAALTAAEQRIKELEGRHHLDQAQVKIVCERIRTLEEKLTAYERNDDAIRSAYGWKRDGRELPELVAELAAEADGAQSALTAAEKERASLRVRMFGLGRVKGSAHSTGCTIWGDNGMGGTPENFSEPPCNCGAIENFLRSSLHAAEEKIAALERGRDALRGERDGLRGRCERQTAWMERNIGELVFCEHCRIAMIGGEDGFETWASDPDGLDTFYVCDNCAAAAKMEKGS